MTPKRERIIIPEVAAILGVSVRVVQRLAIRRELPTAAKVGRLWTFNEAAIRAWLVEQESRPPMRIERRSWAGPAIDLSRFNRRSPPGDNGSSASSQVIRSLRESAK